MLTRQTLLLLLALCCGTPMLRAQTTDKQAVKAVIQMYFDGWMTGDTTLVGKAMHGSCKLKVYRDSAFVEISRHDYLSRFKPHAKEAGTSGRIKKLDITGNIASAKCELETPKAVFTDYFNLMRVGDTWYIVDKVSTRKDKPAPK